MARTDYASRLRLPIVNRQPKVTLYSASGEILASSYTRIVLGGRGPYIECLPATVNWYNFHIPSNLIWKTERSTVDYVEYRSNRDNVKLYLQQREVDYATYKIDHIYFSPFEVYFDPDGAGNLMVVIEKLQKNV